MANVIQEHVIQLGAQVDNQGVNKILGLLDASKLKALSVAGALSAVTTAIYKFVESATKREFELEELAKKQKKSIELTRAENTAMKAMGKTLQQINKDQNLKKIYKDIVEFNKEMQMPKMDQTLQKIRNLEGSFFKLKSAMSYATQYINAEILKNLEEPIARITQKFDRIAKFMRDKMSIYASKIGLIISDFVKGLEGIGRGLGKVIDYIVNLPPGIKAIGAAIAGVIALIKSGPIGQLIALITLVGDFIHDYDNFKFNQENGLKQGDEGYVRNLNDKYGIWDAFEKDGMKGLGQMMIDKINEGLLGLDAEALGEGFGAFLEKAFAKLDDLLSGGGEGGLFDSMMDLGKHLGKKIFEFLHKAMDTINESDIKSHIVNIIRNVFSKLSSGMTKLLHVVIGEKGADGQYKEGLLQYGKKLFLNIIGFISEGAKTIGDSDLGTELGDFINQIFISIGDFLSTESMPTGDLLKAAGNIAQGILDTINKSLTELLKEDNEGKTGIQKFVEGLFDFLSNSINDLYSKVTSGELNLEEVFGNIGTTIGEIIGKMIKIGADFLEEFVSQCLQWLSNGGVEKLVVIGKEILRAILKGMGNIFDAMMESIFGESWTGFKKDMEDRSQLRQNVDEYINSGGRIYDQNGQDITEQAQEIVSNASDVSSAAKQLGFEKRTDYEMYQKGFLEYLGSGELMTSAGGYTYGSNGQESIEQAVAKAFGVALNEDRTMLTGTDLEGRPKSAATTFMGDAEKFSELMAQITNAGNSEDFNKAFAGMKEYLDGLGFATKSEEELNAAMEAGKVSVETYTDQFVSSSSDIATAAGEFVDSIEALAERADQINFGGEKGEGKAYGGRVTSEGQYTLAEGNNPEYVIPITKRARAFQLIDQMISEMGAGAVQHIQEAFGIGNNAALGTIGGSMESIIGSLSGGTNFSISAPVNIYVTATGSDAKEIGTAAYDAAERHLVKTLRGVSA